MSNRKGLLMETIIIIILIFQALNIGMVAMNIIKISSLRKEIQLQHKSIQFDLKINKNLIEEGKQ